MSYVYSFIDVEATIDGTGGSFPLAGGEAGVAEEGITVVPVGEKNEMTVGADGEIMHSLLASKAATITVTLLRTSTVNAQLQNLFNEQTKSSATHGRNTIVIRDIARGDTTTCTKVAFAKDPDAVYAKSGGTLQWLFHGGKVDKIIGSGTPEKE